MATANKTIATIDAPERKHRGLFQDAAYRFLRHRVGIIGAVIIFILIIMGIFGPSIAPYPPKDMSMDVFAPPTAEHPFGTDDFGRDTFSRVLHGARISLMVGVVSVGLAATVGTMMGVAAGYGSRVLDEVIMRFTDILFAFPTILLAITVMAVLGKGTVPAMIAIGIVYIPIFARIARSSVLSVKNEEFIQAAEALGANDVHIVIRHIFPNILAPLIVEISLSLAFAILAEAALSYFGLGTPVSEPSWGSMLSDGREFFRQSPWLGLFPGLAIMLSVMGFNFLGDGLRDVLDPRMKH